MAVHYEIHPSIGIARLGSSLEFFIGPDPEEAPPTTYRDSAGRLLRQAARFRIFRCQRDSNGALTQATEITHGTGGPDQALITWRVKLANRKGAAPRFAGVGRRNNATGNDATDAPLIIGPVAKMLSGIGQPIARFPSAQFKGVDVELGLAGTDSQGRLLVLGGGGRADSVPPQGTTGAPALVHFANNDGWFDDVSDGPVNAQLSLPDGTTIDARGAWVIAAPPDYAPEVRNFVTLYDIAYQVAADQGWLTPPSTPSFEQHIRPILQRAVDYQWVNRLSRTGHGPGEAGDFSAMWSDLADPSLSGPLAQNILQRLRDPALSAPIGIPRSMWMPRLHDENNNTQVLPLTSVQHNFLVQWSSGNYLSDLGSSPPSPSLPDALDRSAFEACSGGAFFPGIEVGRIIRDESNYDAPFHLRVGALEPGQLTAGNAVPWQADFSACQFENQMALGWWPAQRPDHVFTTGSASSQVGWDDGASSAITLIANWSRLGIVRTVAGGEMRETERDPTLLPHH